eukprot:TRINITY_DN4934_c0_g1_i1.p2 TRINITY_DN4934_c0_g1~~TRINITY_DN4934_c0_g1_i1.p2  ORF type:complete len:71 (+),score=8.29 TRINITY_DN4934_c0_g1_i1:69-281(+)
MRSSRLSQISASNYQMDNNKYVIGTNITADFFEAFAVTVKESFSNAVIKPIFASAMNPKPNEESLTPRKS